MQGSVCSACKERWPVPSLPAFIFPVTSEGDTSQPSPISVNLDSILSSVNDYVLCHDIAKRVLKMPFLAFIACTQLEEGSWGHRPLSFSVEEPMCPFPVFQRGCFPNIQMAWFQNFPGTSADHAPIFFSLL